MTLLQVYCFVSAASSAAGTVTSQTCPFSCSSNEAVANEIILLRKGVVLEMQKPASLLEHLNGQVWLVTVPAADEAALTKQYVCSNVMHTDGKSVIRLLSESAPRPDAVQTAPNMEDLYLYYFGR